MNATSNLNGPMHHGAPVPRPPVRKESYTTWLYMGFAVLIVLLTAFGMWYAGQPPTPLP